MQHSIRVVVPDVRDDDHRSLFDGLAQVFCSLGYDPMIQLCLYRGLDRQILLKGRIGVAANQNNLDGELEREAA
jgi:hypothetical protein